DAKRMLPISFDYNIEPDDPPGTVNGMGWIPESLPFMELQTLQTQLYAACYKGNWASGGGMNATACKSFYALKLPALHCPSDTSGEELTTDMFRYVGVAVAQTNYK